MPKPDRRPGDFDAEPSLRATLDAAIARLKLPGAAAFTPDPTSRVHENVQRFVASGLTEEHTWDVVVRPDEVNGLVVLRRRVETMADGRAWLEVAGSEDVIIALGIHDLEDEDPLLCRADMENGWDEVRNAPRTTWPMCRLSELVSAITRCAPVPSVATLLTRAVKWNGALPHRPYETVFASGEWLLTRGQQARDASGATTTAAQSLELVSPDGTIVSVHYKAEHASYITAASWCSADTIVVLGQHANMLTSVGVVECIDGTWRLRELWKRPADAAGAQRASTRGVVATADAFAFETLASVDAKATTLHVWERRSGEWAESTRLKVGRIEWMRFASSQRLLAHIHPKTVEFVIADAPTTTSQATAVEQPSWRRLPSKQAYRTGAVLDQGRLLSIAPNAKWIDVLDDGAQVQRLPIGDHHRVMLAAYDGRVAAYVIGKTPGPAQLKAWRFHDGKYVPWINAAKPHPTKATGPDFLGFAGDTIFTTDRGGTLHRLLAP